MQQQENATSAKLRFEHKRESPLDLSVKTVCRSADSTDDRLHGPFVGHDIPKVNFKPDFNACRVAQAPPPSTAASPPSRHSNNNNNPMRPAASSPLHPPLLQPQPPLLQPQIPVSVVVKPVPTAPPVLLPSSAPDEAWRAAIDRQIEQKFSSYTSAKKLGRRSSSPQPPNLSPQQQHHQPQLQPSPPAQADKRVLEMIKHNIEARDHGGAVAAIRPQIAEAPSTPVMVFSTPVRKEPVTGPLKKHDFYMAAERTATPFPKKIDYYMDRTPYCNAPRIRTKAERKQVMAFSIEGLFSRYLQVI